MRGIPVAKPRYLGDTDDHKIVENEKTGNTTSLSAGYSAVLVGVTLREEVHHVIPDKHLVETVQSFPMTTTSFPHGTRY